MKIQPTHIVFDIKGVLIEKSSNGYTVIPEGLDILTRCHAIKDNNGLQLHTLYALSNAKEEVLQKWQLDFPHIFHRFNGIVISDQIGYKKPDHRIYQHLLQTYQLNPNHCIYIDDSYENVIAAQNIGFVALHCTSHTTIVEHLKNLNVL